MTTQSPTPAAVVPVERDAPMQYLGLVAEVFKYARHAENCRIGSMVGYHQQARNGAPCSCGFDRVAKMARYALEGRL